MIGRIRESFALKVFAGLFATVGALLVVAFAVVRSVTETQVSEASERAVQSASSLFTQLEEIRRQEVARVAGLLGEGRRTLAALDEGDVEYLAGEVAYQIDFFGLPDILVALTDAHGKPVVTLHGQEPMEGVPTGFQKLAERVLADEALEVRGYEVVGDTLYSVRTTLIEEGGRAIGTLSLALPIADAEVERIGALVGVEVCFVVEERCVAGTTAARAGLSKQLVSAGGSTEARRVEALGSAWSVHAQPLIEGDPAGGRRAIAVPLGPVLAPFQRITGALILGGGLALLLSVVVGGILSRGLTRPVRALVEATGRVARGEYDLEVAATTRDELGTLAAAFNDMTRGLLLKERMQSVLNKVVSRDVAEELMQGNLELGGENRRVTVLFADIRGFSSLTDGMEPQRVIGLLNECMQRLSDAVDAEGGVVDKYVGDELMAVFGAPVAQEDDALRALRAALRMQEAMAQLNIHRQARGEPPIGLGVGVNSGVVVAGNMGSKERLNYTVLGDAVNLAVRLCSGAAAGEILATRGCVAAAGDRVTTRTLGGRAFKGFSDEVEVVSVERLGQQPTNGPGVGVALMLLAMACGPGGAAAQGLPTLRELGAEYVSRSGSVQIAPSGQLDLEVFSFSADRFGLAEGNGEGVLLAPRLRFFTDVFVGDHVYALVELRGDRGDAPRAGEWDARLEQAFVRLGNATGSLTLQVGRFASPFGSYAQRHLTPVDPFVRPPIIYDDRTMQCPGISPPHTAGFLSWRDRPDEFRDIGAPPVWGVPYQWGAMVAGTRGKAGYRLAVMNSAPSSEPAAWAWEGDRLRHPSVVAGLGIALSPELSLGASFNRGPWLEELKRGRFPAGKGRWDYLQTVVSVDAIYARGPLMVRAEAVRDQWDVPNMVQAPVELGGSLEVQADLVAGFFAAVRGGLLDFRPVDDADGPVDWDYDVKRYEASFGYWLDRNAGLLASWAHKSARSDLEGSESLLAARLWWAF